MCRKQKMYVMLQRLHRKKIFKVTTSNIVKEDKAGVWKGRELE